MTYCRQAKNLLNAVGGTRQEHDDGILVATDRNNIKTTTTNGNGNHDGVIMAAINNLTMDTERRFNEMQDTITSINQRGSNYSSYRGRGRNMRGRGRFYRGFRGYSGPSNSGNGNRSFQQQRPVTKEVRCYKCGELNHYAWGCAKPSEN